MLRLKDLVRRASAASAAMLLIVCLILPLTVPMQASAGLVTNRSLRLSSSANGTISTDAAGNSVPAGEGGNGARARHTVTFTMDTNNATIGSMIIMYCDSPILQNTCNTPSGLLVNLTSVSVSGLNGTETFSLDTTSTNDDLNNIAGIDSIGQCNGTGNSTTRENCIPIVRTDDFTETNKPTVTITYGGGSSNYIRNPTSDNYSFYARVVIYSDTGYSNQVDYGGLAAATAEQIDILAKVQEILNFSVGNTPTPRDQPACTPISSGNDITIGDSNSVLSTLQAFDNHTYFRINTNTVNGTKVFYSGNTLESGIADINPMPVAIAGPPQRGTQSQPGSEQFGLAIDSSKVDIDNNGQDKGYVFNQLSATAPYHEGNGTITNLGTARFVFDTGSITTPAELASSSGGIDCDTGAVRYVANVSTSTPAGIYRTTLTFIALGTY